jgi:hypothetical protein
MTVTADAARPAGMVPNVGRLVLTVGAVGVVFALSQLLASWDHYSRPWLAAAAWLATAAVPPVAVTTANRHGGVLPVWVLVVLATVLLAVDVVVPAVLPAPERLGVGTWNWGSAAIILLGIAAYRPAREVVALALAHGLMGVVIAVVSRAAGGFDPVAVTLLLGGALIPPVAAAQFLAFYVRGLAARQDALRAHRAGEADRRITEAVQRDSDSRLSMLRAETLPLLEHVARGAEFPLPPATARKARRLAESLRRELVASRARGWLLTALRPQHGQVEIAVHGAHDRLDEPGRSAVVALVSLLDGYEGWSSFQVTVADARPLSVVVMATGTPAAIASADISLQAAMARLGATAWLEKHDLLVVEVQPVVEVPLG